MRTVDWKLVMFYSVVSILNKVCDLEQSILSGLGPQQYTRWTVLDDLQEELSVL